jgi:hypothetical protein
MNIEHSFHSSTDNLTLAVNRGGRDGLYKLFTEKVNGKVRVTSATVC